MRWALRPPHFFPPSHCPFRLIRLPITVPYQIQISMYFHHTRYMYAHQSTSKQWDVWSSFPYGNCWIADWEQRDQSPQARAASHTIIRIISLALHRLLSWLCYTTVDTFSTAWAARWLKSFTSWLHDILCSDIMADCALQDIQCEYSPTTHGDPRGTKTFKMSISLSGLNIVADVLLTTRITLSKSVFSTAVNT